MHCGQRTDVFALGVLSLAGAADTGSNTALNVTAAKAIKENIFIVL
jgi:hypothetical protein